MDGCHQTIFQIANAAPTVFVRFSQNLAHMIYVQICTKLWNIFEIFKIWRIF